MQEPLQNLYVLIMYNIGLDIRDMKCFGWKAAK